MSARSRRINRTLGRGLLSLAAGGLATQLGGCRLYDAAAAPVKLAAATVVVAGKTATSVVTNTGKVAMSAAEAVGNVGSDGIDSASRLAQVGMVTFVDASSGTIVRVPWEDGITLAAAGGAARVNLARRAVDVVRAGRVIYSASKVEGSGAALASGDVVRLGG